MRKVSGYQTHDGELFSSAIDAELHEAQIEFIKRIRELAQGVNVNRLMDLIAASLTQTERYVNALQNANAQDKIRNTAVSIRTEQPSDTFRAQPSRDEPSSPIDIGEGVVLHTGQSITSLLKQSARRRGVLSNMGSGPLSEETRHESEIDGVGGGGDDASDVRSGEDMAIGSHPEPTETRRSDSDEDIREGSVEEDNIGEGSDFERR